LGEIVTFIAQDIHELQSLLQRPEEIVNHNLKVLVALKRDL
jgi:hypothetical protein